MRVSVKTCQLRKVSCTKDENEEVKEERKRDLRKRMRKVII